MKEYLRLLKFLKKQTPYLILAALCMAVSSVFKGVSIGSVAPVFDNILSGRKIILPPQVPDFIAEFVSKINAYEPLTLLKVAPFILGGIFLVRIIFEFLQGLLMTIVAERSVVQVRNKLYEKFQQMPLDFYARQRQGELVSRITNDPDIIKHGLAYGLKDTIYESFQIIIFGGMAFFIHWLLALSSLVIFPLIIYPVLKIGKKVKAFATVSQEKMADLNTVLSEAISGVRIIKAFAREDYETERFKTVNRGYYKFIIKAAKRVLSVPLFTEFITLVAAIIILYIGGKEVIGGRLSFGVFAVFLIALLSMMRPFKKLSRVHILNQQSLAASKRVYAILDMKPAIADEPEALEIKPPAVHIRFEGVWFRYDEQEDYVLKDINLQFNLGKTLAIVGPTGAGKSTLLNLIPRFYEATKGRITVDETDIRKIKLARLRSYLSLVTQDIVLFNDTVRANIGYGNLKANNEEIEEAAKKTLCFDFIKKLPLGFETVVGEKGFRLSGGQKQRLCMARAILKKADILVLDEATSHLDTESEALVQQALDNLMAGKTVFIIAHRFSTVKKADSIVVMDEGRVTAQGSHEELMQTSPLYKKLYDLHFNF